MVNQLFDYDLKTYDGYTDGITLIRVIALWKQYTDPLVLHFRFLRVVNTSLPWVSAPLLGFWINQFSGSAKWKTELGPSKYINNVVSL